MKNVTYALDVIDTNGEVVTLTRSVESEDPDDQGVIDGLISVEVAKGVYSRVDAVRVLSVEESVPDVEDA